MCLKVKRIFKEITMPLENFWVIFYAFVLCCVTFFKINFFKNFFQEHIIIIRVSNGWDPYHSFNPEQGPNCLQRLLVDDKSGL